MECQSEIESTEVFGQVVHILADFVICNSRIDLSCGDVGVTEHLADGFNGNALAECHSGCECVTREVEYTQQCKQQRTGID